MYSQLCYVQSGKPDLMRPAYNASLYFTKWKLQRK